MNLRIAALVSVFSLLVAIPVAILAGQRMQTQAIAALQVLEQELTTVAAQQIEQPLKLGFSGTVEKRLQHVIDRAGDSFVFAKVIKADGVVMAELGALDQPALQRLQDRAAEVQNSSEPWSSHSGFEVVFPILSKKGKMRGTLIMVWDPAPRLAEVWAGLQRDLAIGAGLLLLSVLICVVILKRTLGRPLTDLAAALERIDNGLYHHRIPATGRSDELGQIARRIETLQQSLSKAEEVSNQRQAEQLQQARAVEEMRKGLAALARRDLAYRMTAKLALAYEPLRADFNTALGSISDTMGEVLGTSTAVTLQSSGIDQGSGTLFSRIAEQSQTIGAISSQMVHITDSVVDAADQARSVEGLAATAVREAETSSEVVRQAVAAMSELEESASEISTIIGVIDDIAFQTNLLALNAGVEAARAGTAGAGFAVVASEVRTLSQRTTEAATKIKTLITQATGHISTGVAEVNNTGNALGSIKTSLDTIAERISSSAQKVSSDSELLRNLSAELNQLGAATQDNRSIVSDTVEAAQKLGSDAKRLDTLVEAFRLPSQLAAVMQPNKGPARGPARPPQAA
ncbi:methyl-accepting chemotaxis protein [Phaeobacter sp. PT47_59]|uniref:methyl-accepting chemotaxis protein n=1 Tax=Phaeobacter sp. PT47_59 TaxID=3029979 RepID=UPI0023804D77|nr:methyl-accepting chemotaxis protein [Phaeobacter sp. PT47_59]MDE4172631.1 methyl-accepting chemotaxis protein [Phaeobacter sp. PT47_59]